MNLFSVMSLLACAVYLYMGIYAYFLDRDSKINRLFLYFCISMAVWSFGYAFVYTSQVDHNIWIKIAAVGWCTFSAIVLHSVLVFIKSPTADNRLILILIYIPGFIFLYMSVFLFWPHALPPKHIRDFFNIGNFLYNFIYLLSGIILVWKWGMKSDKIREKKQAYIITVTCVIPFLIVLVTQTILPGIGINLHPPLGQVYCLIMMFGIYYASIRYRLFGISSNLLIEEILTEAMDLIILVSPEGRIVKVNNRTEQLLGYRKKELINENIKNILSESCIIEDILDSSNSSKILRYPELNCIKKNGEIIPVSISCSPIIDPKLLDLLAIVIVGQDITLTKKLEQKILEHEEAQVKLKESEERFRSMFNKHSAVMYLIDAETLMIFEANEAAEKYYGYSQEEFKKIKITDITGFTEEEVRDNFKQIINHNKGIFRLQHRLASGEARDVEVHVSPIPLTNRQMIFEIVSDITERKKAEEHITYLAYHDSLTGLPNRKYFYERFNQELQRSIRSGGKFAVLYLDLDGFKEINDNYGHELGDFILCETGNRIRDCIRASDIIARVGGDEFTLLILDIQCPDDARIVADKITGSLSPPALKDGVSVNIQASIGISVFPNDGYNMDTLINNADNKMYSVKRMKKDNVFAGQGG